MDKGAVVEARFLALLVSYTCRRLFERSGLPSRMIHLYLPFMVRCAFLLPYLYGRMTLSLLRCATWCPWIWSEGVVAAADLSAYLLVENALEPPPASLCTPCFFFVSPQEMGLMEPLVYGDLEMRLNPSGGGGPAGSRRGGSGGGGAEPSPVSAGVGAFSEAAQPSETGNSSDRFSDARAPTTYRYRAAVQGGGFEPGGTGGVIGNTSMVCSS